MHFANRRVVALILAVALVFSSVLTSVAMPVTYRDSGPPAGAHDSGIQPDRPEPNYFSEEYAAYLAELDQKNLEHGVETDYWMRYMVKWGKAIPYEETPDGYVYQEPDRRARAATTTVGALPQGAKIVDPTTKWGSEPMIWVKVSDKVWGPKGEGTSGNSPAYTSFSQIKYGAQWSFDSWSGGWKIEPKQFSGAAYYLSEKTIATLPHNTSPQASPWADTMLDQWLNSSGRNTYLSMNFYDDVLSRDIKGMMTPALTHVSECGSDDSDGRTDYWTKHASKYVGLPINSWGITAKSTTYKFSDWVTANNSVYNNPAKHTYHPSATASGTMLCKPQGINFNVWTVRNVQESTHMNQGSWNTHWNSNECAWGTRTVGAPEYYEQLNSGSWQWKAAGANKDLYVSDNVPLRVRPVIALKDTAVVSATPDSNGVYTLVTSDYCDAPVLVQTVDASLGTILTAYSPNATGLKLFNGSTQVHSVSGTSLVYKVNSTGTYQATATKGSFSVNSNSITISSVASAKPVINISYQDAAQSWAASVKVFFSVSEVANGSTLKPGATVTVTGPGGAVAATHTGSGNYNFTASTNGSYTVKASISGQSTSASTSVTKIDVTAPTAPTITKYPNTAWHSDNVVVALAGGSDAGSGIKTYQYKLGSGGAWTNGASVSVAASNTVYGRVVDNVGKVSGEVSIAVNINRNVPSGTITASTTAWTDKAVTLTFTGTDTGGSGVKRVRPVGGAWVSGSSCTQSAASNGTYYFEVENNAGGNGVVSKAVTNIDTIPPVVGDINFIQKAASGLRSVIYGKQLEINLSAADTGSGVKTIEYQLVNEGGSIASSGWLVYNAAAKPVIQRNFTGYIAIRATDNVGRVSEVKTTNIVVEDVPPTASHMLSPSTPTNRTVTIQVTATDSSGIATIKTPGGTTVAGGNAQHTVSANGKYTFVVTDKCGNQLSYVVDVSNIDVVRPTATHTLSPAGWTNGNVVIRVTGADTASGVASITLPGGTVEKRDVVEYTATANGTYTFTITDGAGNALAYQVVVTGIDRVKPVISKAELAATQRGVRALFKNRVELLLTATDNASGIGTLQYQVADAGAVPGTDGWKIYNASNAPIWDDDMNASIYVRAVDNAGNISDVRELSIFIDMTVPELELTASQSKWFNGDVVITAKFSDNGSGIKSLTLPNGTVQTSGLTTGQVNFTVTKNGTYSFTATDVAGNITTKSITVTVIDRTAPTITRAELTPRSGSAWFKHGVQLEVQATDDYSGVAFIQYKAVLKNQKPSDVAWQAYDAAKPPSWSSDTQADIFIRVQDNTGNEATTQLLMLVDVTAPDLELTQNQSKWFNGDVVITAKFSDNSSGIQSLTLPDGTVQTNALDADRVDFTATKNGTYSFTATDVAGNSTTREITVIVIDRIAPTITRAELTPRSDSEWFKHGVQLEVEATDDYSGVAFIQYKAVLKKQRPNSVAWQDYDAAKPPSWSSDTQADIFIRVQDNTGNETTTQLLMLVDVTAPDLELMQNQSQWFNGDVVVTAKFSDNGSGIKSLTLPDGRVMDSGLDAGRVDYTVTENGTYPFTTTDVAGNSTTREITVMVIDRIAPTITRAELTPRSDSEWFKHGVQLEIEATDDYSGVAFIQYKAVLKKQRPNSVAWQDYDAAKPPSWSSDTQADIFIRVQDNTGNETTTQLLMLVDVTAPDLELTQDQSKWFNGDVVVTAKFSDNSSGIRSLTLPDGRVMDSGLDTGRVDYTVTENGTYPFTTTDVAGNSTTREITVTVIDRIAPTITRAKLTPKGENGWFRHDVQLEVEATDDYSGVAFIQYKAVRLKERPTDIAWKTYDATKPPSWSSDMQANVFIRVRDNTGNETTMQLSMLMDQTAPKLTLSASTDTWTNRDVTISAVFSDANSGIAALTLPDGRVMDSGHGAGPVDYVVTENGTYPFTAADVAGNTTAAELYISGIDRTAPSITRFALAATEENPVRRTLRGMLPDIFSKQVDLLLEAADDYSGVDYMEYQIVKDGAELKENGWKVYRPGVRLDEEAKLTVYARAIDRAGNVSPQMSRSAIIDGSGPVAIHSVSPDVWTKDEVTITVDASDNLTEVASITLPDGTTVAGAVARYTVAANGSYTFTLLNTANVSTQYVAVVANIDPKAPTPPKLDPPTNPDAVEFPWTAAPETLRVYASSTFGVEKYQYSVTQLWPVTARRSFLLPDSAVQWNDSDGNIVVEAEGVHSLVVRTLGASGAISEISTYTIKNDFTVPATETVQYRTSIRLTAFDALSGVKMIVCEHGELFGDTVICPMNRSEVHHYDVYDNAGNVTPVDVEFVYRDDGGDWYPGGDPRPPLEQQPETNLPTLDNTPDDPLTNQPVIEQPASKQPAPPDEKATWRPGNSSGYSSITDSVPPFASSGDNLLARLLTLLQDPLIYASVCFLLLLVAILLLLAARKKEQERESNTKNTKGKT